MHATYTSSIKDGIHSRRTLPSCPGRVVERRALGVLGLDLLDERLEVANVLCLSTSNGEVRWAGAVEGEGKGRRKERSRRSTGADRSAKVSTAR